MSYGGDVTGEGKLIRQGEGAGSTGRRGVHRKVSSVTQREKKDLREPEWIKLGIFVSASMYNA